MIKKMHIYEKHIYEKNLFKKLVAGVLLALLIFQCGCANKVTSKVQADETPVYIKKTTQYELMEGANPYAVRYCDSGFAYYVSNAVTVDDSELTEEYTFYYQAYDVDVAVEYCSLSDCSVRDFYIDEYNGKLRLSILAGTDEAGIYVCEGAGETAKKISIDNMFSDLKVIPQIIADRDEYVIAISGAIYQLASDGTVKRNISANDRVANMFAAADGSVYAVLESNVNGKSSQYMALLDFSKGRAVKVCDLQPDVLWTFAFGEKYVSGTKDYITSCEYGEGAQEILVNLEKQGLVGAQIRYFFGDDDCFKIVSMDPYSDAKTVFMFELSLNDSNDSDAVEADEEKYSSDGRRIVKVAIPDSCAFQVEFHAGQYNQISDSSFVEVERFKGTLEDYLGKGNRPDIIMFNDNTEVEDYIRKGLLTDLLPMIESSDSMSADDLIPEAVSLLGGSDGASMYAIASRFQLLLRTSDGAELKNGKCDAAGYLEWYGDFMSTNSYSGMGRLENLLYANVPLFYDAESGSADFTSADFKKLLETYKKVWESNTGYVTADGAGEKDLEIAGGPRWSATYRNYALTEPGVALRGLPGVDGNDHVYMRLCEPMSILNTSECKEYAFEFIAYYTALNEPLMKGESTSDYHKSGNTMALFSTYTENLRLGIYESEKTYCTLSGYGEVYFTSEQISNLKELIQSAEADTAEQRTIYNIVMEELDSYLAGAKSLDEVCEVIQNRASIYLYERM